MNRNRTSQALVASPVLVGAVTLLVVIVGVFLAYNANSGLPFVPTYTLKAELPTGAKLVKGNEVRIGGFRVGAVSQDRGRRAPPGRAPAGDRRGRDAAGQERRAAAAPTPACGCARARRWA